MGTQIEKHKKKKLFSFEVEKGIFYPPAVLLILALIIGLIAPEKFEKGAATALNFTIDYFGWMYLLFTFIFFMFVVIVMFSPVGKIKLGGADAKPELNLWNWWCIALCGGIGTGIVFWGVAEPLIHYCSPPVIAGVTNSSPGSAIYALQISYLHWAFHPYAIYAVFGLAVAYMAFNYQLPFRVSSALYPILGEKIHGTWGKSIDSLVVFSQIAGIITSMGFGVMQLARGLDFLFGLTPSNFLYVFIVTIVTLVYTISSYTGLQSGIKWLSDKNSKIFIVSVIFLLVVGPTKFLFDLGTQSFGGYLQNLFSMSFYSDPFSLGSGWTGNWTIFYWAWWIVVAPLMGTFLARISYGRTIREFLIVNVLAPGLFGIVWFTTYGGSAIYLDRFKNAGIMNTINQYGSEVATYALFKNFPLDFITVPIAILAVAISFITLANSMTSTISTITSKHATTDEAPGALKVFWGVLMGCLTILFLVIGGTSSIKGLQTTSIVAALPIFILEITVVVSLILAFYKKGHRTSDILG